MHSSVNTTKRAHPTHDHPPEAIAHNRFTSSSPLASSSGGSLSSSGPLAGVSGDVGSEGSFPVAAINSARGCLGPVSESGFSRKVIDAVRQMRGPSKYIRTKATVGLRLCGKLGHTSGGGGRTNVHYELEYCDPCFLLS